MAADKVFTLDEVHKIVSESGSSLERELCFDAYLHIDSPSAGREYDILAGVHYAWKKLHLRFSPVRPVDQSEEFSFQFASFEIRSVVVPFLVQVSAAASSLGDPDGVFSRRLDGAERLANSVLLALADAAGVELLPGDLVRVPG